MIKKIKLVNFRNFQSREFFFSDDKNYIIGENGKGKTNILESLSLLTGNSITGISFDNLVKYKENFFHIEMENELGNSMVIFFDKKLNKKKYSVNKKNTTKKNFSNISLKSVIFSPIVMNLFYLGPTLRREFLDSILLSSFSEYDKVLKNYKKSLLNRNKVLKYISKNKSEISEIYFWDKEFIKNAVKVYEYRKIIVDFLINNCGNLVESFSGKINKIRFEYISKVCNENFHFLEEKIKKYLEENLEKDIILKTTSIGPHRDDFNLIIDDNINLIDFASRGETKTIILGLKYLEIQFIEQETKRKPILIVDDLLSELDKKHKNLFLDKIHGYQTFITGIALNKENIDNVIKI